MYPMCCLECRYFNYKDKTCSHVNRYKHGNNPRQLCNGFSSIFKASRTSE